MRSVLALLVLLVAPAAHAQAVDMARLTELLAAEARLAAMEEVCLIAVVRPYSVSLLFLHRVAFEALAGETNADAANRTCAAQSATLNEGAAISTYCGACDYETRIVETEP